MNLKHIYVLIGPKGSGKSFIGTIFQKQFNIDLIRVEDWFLDLKIGAADISDDKYVRQSFQIIEKGIREAVHERDSLVFESTGLTEHFDNMLLRLKSDYSVITIKINTDIELCLKRVQERDQSIHINISDEQVEKINSITALKHHNTDFTIENSDKSVDDLIEEIKKIIESSASNS